MRLLQSCAEPNLGIPLGAYLMHHCIWTGDLLRAGWVMDALRRLTRMPAVTPLAQVLGRFSGAVYHWARGERRACLDQVAAALDRAHATGMHTCDAWLYAQGVYGNLVAGELETAEAFLRDMALAMRSHTHMEGGHYHYLSALLAQQRGDFAQGLNHARQALAMTIEAGTPFPQAVSHIATALLLLEQGEDAEGEEHLHAARAIGQCMDNGFIEHFCLLIEARTAFERGQEVRGLERLRKALALSLDLGGCTAAWWGPVTMAQLYAKALEAGIEVEYIQAVIRRMQLTPPDPATAPDNWPWPIKVYTLGRFSVVKDGEPLRFQGKAKKKPLELLQYLTARGGHEAPEEKLADALWPDSEGDAAYRSLISALQRLRQWLGHPEAVELSGGQLSLNPKWVWVDSWAFERLLEQAEEARKQGDDKARALAEKALQFYRRPFLDQVSEPWAVSCRERLCAKFRHHLVALGRAWEANGRWEEAVACYLRGIEADERAEVFYQQLIRCYRQLGRDAEARAVYERLRKLLSTTLGIAPSPQTQALARTLYPD